MHVDKHGDPIRPGVVIEWEGTAERVACHPPYVLLFDSQFIEVRYIDTGRLAQIIPGNDIRCIWDGRGVSTNSSMQRPLVDPREQQEAKVHAVMTNQDGTGRKAIAQCVFELVPTVPLFPPAGQISPVRQQHQQRPQEYLPHQPHSPYQQHSPQHSIHQGQTYSHPSVGDAPPVGYGYDQGSNGYGYQPQVAQQQYAGYYATASPTVGSVSASRQTSASASIPRQQYVGTGYGPHGTRPSTAGSWRS